MIVMKFGGTSLRNAERVRIVGEIVQGSAERNPLVVVSAHAGVTNRLHALAQDSLKGDFDTSPIREMHESIIADLGLPSGLIDEVLDELGELVRGIYLVREVTPRTHDYVVSFGERFSSRIVAAHLKTLGLKAAAANAYDLGFVTDSTFGAAQPLPEAEENVRRAVADTTDLLVVTGYVAKNKKGEITTVGRSGSDFTATYFGAAVRAEEVQIWTDVDGIMTADPTIVSQAKPVAHLSFEEASELAYYGAEVIHPATMIPAIRRDIPVRVLNTYRLEYAGTLITRERPARKGTAESIVYKEDLTMINIVSTRMLLHHGFMAKLFEVFNRYGIVIDMISTSEVTVSLTTVNGEQVADALEEIATFAEAEAFHGKTIVCVVGQGIKKATDTPHRIFSALAPTGIDIQMISQGASKINIAFLIDDSDRETAVKALHAEFFETP